MRLVRNRQTDVLVLHMWYRSGVSSSIATCARARTSLKQLCLFLVLPLECATGHYPDLSLFSVKWPRWEITKAATVASGKSRMKYYWGIRPALRGDFLFQLVCHWQALRVHTAWRCNWCQSTSSLLKSARRSSTISQSVLRVLLLLLLTGTLKDVRITILLVLPTCLSITSITI